MAVRNTQTPKGTPKKAPDMNVIGVSGVKQYGGYIAEEFLPELKGSTGRKTYRQMADNDPIIGAMLLAFKSLFRSVEWSWQLPDESPQALDAQAFIEEVFADMDCSLADVMADICSMFVYGFAPIEILFKRRLGPEASDKRHFSIHDDGKIGLRGLPLRKQETILRWEIDKETGEILGIYQQPWERSEVFIPKERFLLFRTEMDGNNPEGRSVLRNCYRPHYFKRKIEEIEAVGVERDLAGLPIARIPSSFMDSGADAKSKQIYQAYQTMVTNIRKDKTSGLVLPSDRDPSGNLLYTLELLSTGSSRQNNTTGIIERYSKEIATSALADFIFLGQSSVGSFALSSDKTALFAQAVMAYVNGVAGVFNQQLIPSLWAVNGFDFKYMPKMHPSDVETPSLEQLAAFISQLSGAGAQLFPDNELENALRKKAGLPLVPEDREDMNNSDGLDDEGKPKGGKKPGDKNNNAIDEELE